MSVLIKGMEMPKNCAECPCRMIGYTADYCNVLGKFIDFAVGSDGRRKDCPLIELPPHGRLIDADALLKLLDSCMFPSDMVTTRALSMATNWLKEAPTVIPADKDGET